MFKAVKKLKKFWPRKKRKKKLHQHHQPDPLYHITSSSSYHSSSYSSYSIPPPPPPQPSAPPLPPWLETSPMLHTRQDLSYYPAHTQFMSPEIAQEPTPYCSANSLTEPSSSYQRYLDPLPAYEMPVVQQQTASTKRKESAHSFFTFIVKFGTNLFGCFLPCFQIQEVPPSPYTKPLALSCS